VAGDVESLRRVRQCVPCVIAADEALLTGASRVLEQTPVTAAQVIVLKPMVLGGLLPALSLAKRARDVGVDSYVTTSLDGPIARAAAAQLASVIAGPYSHGVSTYELFEGVAADRFTPKNGTIRAFDDLGWGV
jgi:L-alanine-DL-glutamate epimerase-like enolase superfamily enzyme